MSLRCMIERHSILMSSYVVIMMVRRNDNDDDTYGCNTTRNSDGSQGGASTKDIITLMIDLVLLCW